MASPDRKLCIVIPQLHRRGGQERSTLELVDRLLARGWQITVISFVCDDECLIGRTNLFWIRVPGLSLPSELLKNLFFFIWTTAYCLTKVTQPILTVGVATGRADFRVIQFFHHRYRHLVKTGQAVFPNERSFLHKMYQNINSLWNVFLERRLLKKAQLVAISQSVADTLRKSLNLDKIKIIRHAPDKVGNLEKKNESEKVRILFVGALERKGIQTVLPVLSRLKVKNWQMDVVGAGNIEHWRAMSVDLKIDDRVVFHGKTPASSFFAQADVFFFPSLYEPFGLVVSEAISYGAIALASSECGAMELWPHRPEKLRLSATDPVEKWREALESVLIDKNWRRSLVEESQQSAFSWDWDQVADSYETLFGEVDGEKTQVERAGE